MKYYSIIAMLAAILTLTACSGEESRKRTDSKEKGLESEDDAQKQTSSNTEDPGENEAEQITPPNQDDVFHLLLEDRGICLELAGPLFEKAKKENAENYKDSKDGLCPDEISFNSVESLLVKRCVQKATEQDDLEGFMLISFYENAFKSGKYEIDESEQFCEEMYKALGF